MTDSYSARLKEELWQKSAKIEKDCCRRSFFAALLSYKAHELPEHVVFPLGSPAQSAALKKLTKHFSLTASENETGIAILKNEAFERLLRLLGIGDDYSNAPVYLCADCFGHFLRGVFLSCGTLADPEKSHHLSLFAKARSAHLKELIEEHAGITFKQSARRNAPYLYVKSLTQIEDVLTLIGAGHVTMELLDSDLEHGMRALVNRQNNFDTANLSRTLEWNRKVLSSIETLKTTGRYDALPPALKAVARFKSRYPNDTLQKLGTRLKPALSKSGVYHRLKKLVDLAGE